MVQPAIPVDDALDIGPGWQGFGRCMPHLACIILYDIIHRDRDGGARARRGLEYPAIMRLPTPGWIKCRSVQGYLPDLDPILSRVLANIRHLGAEREKPRILEVKTLCHSHVHQCTSAVVPARVVWKEQVTEVSSTGNSRGRPWEEEVHVTEDAASAQQARPQNIPRNLKPYFLCFLVKGERWDDPAGADTLMPAQLAFLREQIEWHRYKVAGPVTDGGEIVGFSIVEAADADAALALAQQDPAVTAGRVAVRILPAILPSLDSLKIEFPKVTSR